jgi:hypothetical protein
MTNHLILIRHSGLRIVAEEDILKTLTPDDLARPRSFVSVETQAFANDADDADWSASERYLRDAARSIRSIADAREGSSELRYFGLAEIPHVVALGAFLSDERHIKTVDYDRQQDRWAWPAIERTLTLVTSALPSERVVQPGIAVVRVSISAAITDDDVTAAVGPSRVADVTIEPADGRPPQVQLVRSPADVEHVRETLRAVISAITTNRPAVEAIHLFIAAPVSASFVIGQELHLRSSVPVYTYRFRRIEGSSSYTEAIRLSASDVAQPLASLSESDRGVADAVRGVWREALAHVQDFAAVRQRERVEPPGIWYGALRIEPLIEARVFPALPPLWTVADARDAVAPDAFEGDYGLDKDDHVWRLGDRLLLGLHAAAGGDTEALTRLIQLFLFHEYVHEHNRLTKYSAAGVGAFPNCLEHIDYAADLYAIFHQLAWAETYDRLRVRDEDARRLYVLELIDLALRSFWAFDQPLPIHEWQVRRLRRYLNWYWRYVQVKRAPSFEVAVWTLARQPAVELSGIAQRVVGRRVLANLARRIPGEHLALGVVLENEQMMRIGDSPVTNLGALLDAFAAGEHESIHRFFNAVYEEAASRNGQFPRIFPRTP